MIKIIMSVAIGLVIARVSGASEVATGSQSTSVVSTEVALTREIMSIESDWSRPVASPQDQESSLSSGTKLYTPLPAFGELVQVGVLVSFDEVEEWQATTGLLKMGSWFTPLGRWGELEGFVETYLDGQDFSQSEVEPHLAFSFGAGRVWTVIDPALRLRFDGRDPAVGLLGVVAARVHPLVSLGVRTLADWNEEQESIHLGPSLEFEAPSGWYGFAFVGNDFHADSGQTLAMLRLGVAL